jgi:hypothetical protein
MLAGPDVSPGAYAVGDTSDEEVLGDPLATILEEAAAAEGEGAWLCGPGTVYSRAAAGGVNSLAAVLDGVA